jgi:hypothetical protein
MKVSPTATHHDVDKHDTERNLSSMLPGLGMDATDQVVPFHTSINISIAVPVFVSPTATHHEVDTHETELKRSENVPAFGLGTTTHNVPFHTSTNVSTAVPVSEFPTATHHDALTQEIEDRTLGLAPSLGLGTTTALSTTAPAGADTTTPPNTSAKTEITATADRRIIMRPMYLPKSLAPCVG